ncbi:uncharacterized protein JCM6883_002154 [Sporobolomyces salmoneus]|uniref:uncharacterized protein n=1 Tax=Sporobolomyces salmoneus TaxID=183962 RepID=UPI00316C2823
MLSTLPPELLREIIESTVPHSFHSTTYRTRQNTLCALSLVSKRFQAIAQPILSEIAWIQSSRELNRFRTRGGGGGGGRGGRGDATTQEHVGKHAVLDRQGNNLRLKDGSNLKRIISAVNTLTINLIGEANLSCSHLESLNHLTSLQLCDIDWEVPDRLLLPQLQSLTLFSVPSSFHASLLNPVVLPNLRNLALGAFPVDFLDLPFTQQLLSQLETLNLHHKVWVDPAATFLHGAAAKTLLDLHVREIVDLWLKGQDIPLSHLRIYGCSGVNDLVNAIMTAAQLDMFASFLGKNTPSPLRTLYLDPDLRDSHSSPSRLRHSVETLVRACQQNRIDIVFEKGPVNFTVDPHISPDFVRRQKERRKQESEDAEEGMRAGKPTGEVVGFEV